MSKSSARDEVVIVRGNEVVRVPGAVWDLIKQCAGQMINDGHHLDYYKTNTKPGVLNLVQPHFRKLP